MRLWARLGTWLNWLKYKRDRPPKPKYDKGFWLEVNEDG